MLRKDYILKEEYDFSFDKLPSLRHLDDADYQAEMADIVDEVVAAAREKHGDCPPLGVATILATDSMTRKTPPNPPWFENRRHMVVWDDLSDPEVCNYIDRYLRVSGWLSSSVGKVARRRPQRAVSARLVPAWAAPTAAAHPELGGLIRGSRRCSTTRPRRQHRA